MPAMSPCPGVAVVVKRGLLRTGSVLVDGEKYRVRRAKAGWFLVGGRTPFDAGRVRFERSRDRATLERSDETVVIQFRLGETVFGWQGRPYRVGTMQWGQIEIEQEGRPVARGHVTVTGVHLEMVAPELLPIIRELAFALTMHSEWLAEDRRVMSRGPPNGG